MEFKFTATRIIEAKSMDEAKEKFADSSWNFAANADCHEIEPSPKEKLKEITDTVADKLRDDMQYGNIRTEDQFYRHLQEYVEDQLSDFSLNLEIATSGLLKSKKEFREKTRKLVYETVLLESYSSVKENHKKLFKKVKEQR